MNVIRRAASLAALPVTTGARLAGAAAAAALGADSEQALNRARDASLNAVVDTLAKARGPAMKFGQVAGMLATALPEEQRQLLGSLNRLYESAEPQPWEKVARQLECLPDGVEVDRQATAAASLGQVHRGTWTDGTPVAVKVQYADAAKAVQYDMVQLRMLAPVLGRILPNLDVGDLLDEHHARLREELDFALEGDRMRRFAEGWAGSDIVVPRVLFASPKVLVTEWVDGTSFADLAAASQRERDRAGELLLTFTLQSPRRVRATHADPHPGNFRLLPDGRLAVLDFGSVAEGSGMFTGLFTESLRLSMSGDRDGILTLWQESGLLGGDVDADRLWQLLDPDPQMLAADSFRFTADWLADRGQPWQDPSAALSTAGAFRFPPEYLLEHRAVMGMLALLCKLDCEVPFGRIVLQR